MKIINMAKDHIEINPDTEDELDFLKLFQEPILAKMNISLAGQLLMTPANINHILSFCHTIYEKWVELGRPKEWDAIKKRIGQFPNDNWRVQNGPFKNCITTNPQKGGRVMKIVGLIR